MNIIPAIDIKDGKVVKAKQGDRDRYNPISKDSGFSSDPFKFIKEMAKVYRPSIFYIADINSLISQNHNIDLNTIEGGWKTNLKVRPEKDWEKLKGRAVID